MWVATATECREADRRVIQGLGVPQPDLMRRAAQAAYRVVRLRFPAARRIVVLAGPGNNGGDAALLAGLLTEGGLAVSLLRVVTSGSVQELPPFEAFDLVVDGLFGTGITRAPAGLFLDVIERVNGSGRPVLSLDVPSGMDSDTGEPLGVCVRATHTVMFGLAKRCAYTPGGAHCGTVTVDDIGFPGDTPCGARTIEWRESRPSPRPKWAHKGTCGHVLVVAGSDRYHGAAVLAAMGALRAGAGLVTVASSAAVLGTVRVKVPEAVCLEVRPGETAPLKRVPADAAVVGPGLGEADAFLAELFAEWEVPTCLDADALNAVARGVTPPAGCVMTPHPGEAARLLETSSAEVEADRFGAAARLAERFGASVVLKGAHTLVAGTGRPTWVSTTGNPGMATGGMGDVLAGMVGTFLAQGAGSEGAVHLHGAAGDLCASGLGHVGFTASELAAQVPRARAKLDQCCASAGS